MSCKMLQGGHRSAHNTRGTADGFLEIKDMKKEEGRKQKVRRLQWRRTRCWMIQIEQCDVESVLTSMTSSFRLHLQFPGYPMTVSHTFCRHENPLLNPRSFKTQIQSPGMCIILVTMQAPKTSRSNREFELYPNTCDFFLSYLIKAKYIQRKLRLRTRG